VDLEPRQPAVPNGHPDRRPLPRPGAPARNRRPRCRGPRRQPSRLARRAPRRARQWRHRRAARRRPEPRPARHQGRRARKGAQLLRDQLQPNAATPSSASTPISSDREPSRPGAKPWSDNGSNNLVCAGQYTAPQALSPCDAKRPAGGGTRSGRASTTRWTPCPLRRAPYDTQNLRICRTPPTNHPHHSNYAAPWPQSTVQYLKTPRTPEYHAQPETCHNVQSLNPSAKLSKASSIGTRRRHRRRRHDRRKR
jgi:hypothetical protein